MFLYSLKLYVCLSVVLSLLPAGGPLADVLQQALLPIVSYDVCRQPDWWSTLVTDKMVCAGGDGQLASCNVSSLSASLHYTSHLPTCKQHRTHPLYTTLPSRLKNVLT